MDCRVVVEAAVPVYDVETADEAVRIAISKTGEMLNPDLNYVEINMGERSCPHCGEELEPAFIAADESLVALELEMTVFNVEREEHAARIARKEIGQRLENIPLEVLEIEELVDEDDEDDDEADDDEADDDEADDDEADDDEADDDDAVSEANDGDGTSEQSADGGSDEVDDATTVDSNHDETGDEDDEVLPEFEELIDE